MGPTFNKIKKNKNISNLGRRNGEREETEREKFVLFIYFSSLISLFNLRKSDRQNSSGQEAK